MMEDINYAVEDQVDNSETQNNLVQVKEPYFVIHVYRNRLILAIATIIIALVVVIVIVIILSTSSGEFIFDKI